MTLVMVGGIVLDTQQSEKELLSDCSCTEQIQVQQQEAGWFFGWHKTVKGRAYRVFGITVKRHKPQCATYE